MRRIGCARRVAAPQARYAMTAPRLCASTTLNDANCALKCFVHLACHFHQNEHTRPAQRNRQRPHHRKTALLRFGFTRKVKRTSANPAAGAISLGLYFEAMSRDRLLPE